MTLNPAAPAPASDATLAAAPPFILVEQTWDDAEWRQAAASRQRTSEQQYLFAGGPRPHPWGAGAFVGTLPDGRRAYFPSEAAFRAYSKQHGDDPAESVQAGAGALDAINAGLAAKGKPAQEMKPGDPALEDERNEAAAPQGAAAT